ncbi:Family with sequence similarity 60, member A [Chamberlinius hualienensis]
MSSNRQKMFRSVEGCCICKAKSSSSRFTASQKYESEFQTCFKINEERKGEICNACVLLVKRWKKLPPGTIKNWNHVIDARSKRGFKSQLRKRNVNKLSIKSAKLTKNIPIKTCQPNSPGLSDDVNGGDESLSDHSSFCGGASATTSSAPSPIPSESSEYSSATSRKSSNPLKLSKRNLAMESSPYADESIWKMIKFCCGHYYQNADGQALVDLDLIKPCSLNCKTFASITLSSKSPSSSPSEVSANVNCSQLRNMCLNDSDDSVVVEEEVYSRANVEQQHQPQLSQNSNNEMEITH